MTEDGTSVSTHALHRAVSRMARDGVVDIERRRAMLGYDQLGEIEQQFQIPCEGTVTGTPVWTDVTIAFDVDFFEAQEQRDSPLSIPQMSVGAVLTVVDDEEDDAGGVAYSAFVTTWDDDERGAFTGCTVRVGMWVPGGDGPVNVEGLLHLSFQGYGSPNEDSTVEADLDIGT